MAWKRCAAACAALVALSGVAWGFQGVQEQPAAVAQAEAPKPFQRVVEEDGGNVVKLEMAVREFAPPKEGMPTVFLAAAVHIGERAFYESLQRFLDSQDVVLFEGVKPPGAGDEAHEEGGQGDEARSQGTKRRIRFVATAVERYRAAEGHLPESFEALIDGSEGRIAALLKGSVVDRWGRKLEYSAKEGEGGKAAFDIVSLGADGEPGGEEAAADLKYSQQKPLKKAEVGEGDDGIQAKLAKALGLVFQLDAMNHDKPNWRNSDLSIDQVQARLEKAGADGGELFSMLDGSSLMGRLASFMLGMVAASPELQATMRLMMIDVVGHADKMFDNLPGEMGTLMGVILDERNAVVMEDLKRVIASEPGVKSIAIIYGGGHLPGLERGLAEMGYTPAGDQWRAAMRVDAKQLGMSAVQLKRMREATAKTFERQLKAAKRSKGRK